MLPSNVPAYCLESSYLEHFFFTDFTIRSTSSQNVTKELSSFLAHVRRPGKAFILMDRPVSYSGWAPIADGPLVHLLYSRRAPGFVYYIVHGPGICLLYSAWTPTMTGKVVLYYSTMYMYTWYVPLTLEGTCVA